MKCNVKKGSVVKYVLEMLNKVEQVSLVHNLGALNLHCDLQGGRGQAGRISWVELGEPHVAYHWTVELIKKKKKKNWVSATESCSLNILNNPWVGNEVIWESSLLITSH